MGCGVWLATIKTSEAGYHELTAIRNDSVDLTATIEWDFDNPPSDGFAAGVGREFLEGAFRQMASSVFTATEGRFRVCKVFVHKDSYRDQSVDILIANQSGRAHAPFLGLRTANEHISAFVANNGRRRDETALGKTLAHELGHYGLNLGDEYTEPKDDAGPPALELRRARAPQHCDVTLDTLMGSKATDTFSIAATYRDAGYPAWSGRDRDPKYLKYDDCYLLSAPTAGAGKEDATWRTGHFRHHQRSAWEVIAGDIPTTKLRPEGLPYRRVEQFPSIRDGGVPRTLTQPSFDGNCFQAIFLEPFVIFTIDRSGSMAKPTPNPRFKDETYFDRAKADLKVAIASLPPKARFAVIQHADTVSNVIHPTIFEPNLAANFQTVIDSLQVTTANTTLDLALNRAIELFEQNADHASPEVVLAVTDGAAVVGDGSFGKFQRRGVPIFGQIGDPSTRLAFSLRVADLRGVAKASEVLTYPKILAHLKTRPVRVGDTREPRGQEPMEAPFDVTELDRRGETTFRASLSAPGDLGVFELVDPTGATITPSALPPGVAYETDAQTMLYRVVAPMVGSWKPRFTLQTVPKGNVRFDIHSDTSFSMNVSAQGSGIYPEPWFVYAKLSMPTPIVGAQVIGKLQRKPRYPNEVVPPPTDVAFRDDGIAPDERPNDGIYSGVVATVTDDGVYALDVQATNSSGQAKVDGKSVLDEPGEAPLTMPLTAFTRTGSPGALTAQGFRDMPQSPTASPLHVRNDLTPVWVTVNKPGDVVWLDFNGYAKGKYVAMTGAMISNDGNPQMKTRLTLYEPDGTTVIGTSALDDGTASVDLDTPAAPNEKKYLAKVEIVTGGVGRFQVAVAPRDWFVDPKSASANSADDDCDCRAPGRRSPSTTAAEVSLAGAIVVGALRRARRRSRKAR